MVTREDYETEAEDSRDSKRSTPKSGFFARRRARKQSKRPADAIDERLDAPGRESKRLQEALRGSGPRRVDLEARKGFEKIRDRREFLRRSAIGAGILALGAGLGYGSGYAHATGLSGNTRTVITDNEVAARVIGGVRIATEFIPDPVPAGSDADPYPGSAIQAALNDGLHVYVPAGTWRLTSTITRPVDGATLIGAGRSTKLVFDGVSPCISAASRGGWLITNLATDAGGVDVSSATESRISEIWINGILTDNRPIASGGGGSGGYYGVRAEDFITQGDGSATNPYNAGAIQSAINALPSRGGIVFIKSGVWRGTSRITVNVAGTERTKKVIFQGEGAMHRQIYFHDAANSDSARVGTHVQAGFDIYLPCDFYDMEISPHPNNYGAQPCIDFIVDPTKGNSDYEWTVGHTVKRVRLFRGSHGIRYRGVNMGSIFVQIWGVEIEQVGFSSCGRGFRMHRDDFDSTAPSQGARINMSNCEFRSCTSGPGFDFDMSSSKAYFTNFLLEGTGAAGANYAFRVNTFGEPCVIDGIDFGDTSNSDRDCYIVIGRHGDVRNIRYRKTVDLGGRLTSMGWVRGGGVVGTGVINIIGGSTTEVLTIEEGPESSGFEIGTVSSGTDKGEIRIKRAPGRNVGFIGATTPGPSPFTYTNLDMYDEVVYLVGGTVTGVTRNGQSLGAQLVHPLAPGDSIVITYSSAPSIRRFAVG